MLLSIFGSIFMLFSCKSRIFFSHLQSAAKKVEKFFRGVNRLFQRALCMKCAYFPQGGREKKCEESLVVKYDLTELLLSLAEDEIL